MVQLHSLVDERLGRQSKTLLFPVRVLVYLRPYYLLYQVLGVRPPYTLRRWVRPVRHNWAAEGGREVGTLVLQRTECETGRLPEKSET